MATLALGGGLQWHPGPQGSPEGVQDEPSRAGMTLKHTPRQQCPCTASQRPPEAAPGAVSARGAWARAGFTFEACSGGDPELFAAVGPSWGS